MSLLHALILAQFKIVVVNFNHQKRDASILDHELVKEICDQNKIPYHYIKLSIKNGNFQEEARDLRYKHLNEIAKKYGTHHIITAHHGDDLIETVLMKLIRGSNLLGYSAMQIESHHNDFIYHKPLLNYTKNEIYLYANYHNLKFNEDHTNNENDYFRNRMRNQVIPLIKEENNLVQHFNQFSNQAFLASDYIRSQSKKFLSGNLSFSLVSFNSLHEAVKTDVISFLLEKVNAERSYKKIYKILSQLSSIKPTFEIKISKDYVLLKQYDLVELKENKDLEILSNIPLLNISHKKEDSPNNSIELCYNKLDFPIKIRTRLAGDVLSFPFGHKKLKSFLIDKKIPKNFRDNLLVITDNQGIILWIPNLYVNQTLGETNKIYLSIKE